MKTRDLFSTNSSTHEEVTNETFVRVADYIPDIVVDLRYATTDNFTGQRLYDFTEAWLRYGTTLKLLKAQEILRKQGYGLKIWDAFRPVAAQFVMWEIYPDDTFIANPIKGYSWHSRGNTVDVTIVDQNGAELLMPTPFDNFFYHEKRKFNEEEQKEVSRNFHLLQDTMVAAGFRPYEDEWWHFYDLDEYEVEQNFRPD